ncbi:hypothetical protein POM88_013879 [Heracleum sosnowskyi]|uniref:Uncharacterized protein n=1 Tax=Heracleum sosnowskyi TaxID=360622 RepID=A0AAD8J0Q9_9APIA|nr:hypothetical protein POM88_013879 [Heracleum sosnowskyi]
MKSGGRRIQLLPLSDHANSGEEEGRMVLFDPNPDLALVLLRAFHQHLWAGHPPDPMASYIHAKETHPAEFEIVSQRARAHGDQNGVPGDTYKYRTKVVLKGHHNHIVNGVCRGVNGTYKRVIRRSNKFN